MRGRLRLDIPNDWNQEDGYNAVLFCIPNSKGWRVTINSLISLLTAGRTWNGETGSIIEAQAIGRKIFNSMGTCEDITLQLTRIADALTVTDGEGGETSIAQYAQHLQSLGGIPGSGDTIQRSLQKIHDKIPSVMSLSELAETIAQDSWIGTFADASEVLSFLRDIFPLIDVNIKLDTTGLIMGILGALVDRVRFNAIMAQWTQSNVYLAGIATAEAGEDVIGVIDEATDNIWEGIGSIAELLIFADQYYDNLSEFLQNLFNVLFGPDASPDANLIASKLDAIAANIQGLSDMQININIDNCCDGATGEPPTDGQPVEDDNGLDDNGGLPDGFTDAAEYLAYKCKAANQLRKYLADMLEAIGTNIVTVLDNRTWQNAIKIYEYLDDAKYDFMPNAISYNMTPASLASFVLQINNWFVPAWRGTVFIYDGSNPIPITGYTHFAMIRGVANHIRNNDDLICNLLGDANTTDVKSSLGLAITEAIDAAYDDLPGAQQNHWNKIEVSDWVNLCLTNAFVNIMFTNSAFTTLPYADCSDCGPDPSCPDFRVEVGTQIGSWEVRSVSWFDHQRIAVDFGSDEHLTSGPWCGPMAQFSISLNGWVHKSDTRDDFRIWKDSDAPFDTDNASVYSSDNQPSPSAVFCGRQLVVMGAYEFTLTITKIADC